MEPFKSKDMGIYGISKNQLIVIWIFGLIAWWRCAYEATLFYHTDYKVVAGIASWLIAFALVYYTISWRNKYK